MKQDNQLNDFAMDKNIYKVEHINHPMCVMKRVKNRKNKEGKYYAHEFENM